MSTTLDIILTSQDGVTLNTEGTYCDKDITIVPQLEERAVAPTIEEQIVTVSDGYAGIKSVTIEAIQTEEKMVIPTKEIQEITPTDDCYLSKVTIEPIPDEYVIPSGSLAITENGTFSVTDIEEIVVDVPISNNELPTLNPPTLLLEDGLLTITDTANGDFTESYDIYGDNVLIAVVEDTSVDLTTLFTDVGEYVVTAIAKGSCFKNSEESNAVNYIVNPIENSIESYDVVIMVQNSTDTAYWTKTEVFADKEGAIKIGSIFDADGSTTVSTNTGYVRVQFSGTEMPWAGTITTSGGVEELYHNDYYAEFSVSSDGTITIDGWDFSY